MIEVRPLLLEIFDRNETFLLDVIFGDLSKPLLKPFLDDYVSDGLCVSSSYSYCFSDGVDSASRFTLHRASGLGLLTFEYLLKQGFPKQHSRLLSSDWLSGPRQTEYALDESETNRTFLRFLSAILINRIENTPIFGLLSVERTRFHDLFDNTSLI
jgi:hypothetical protein